MAPRAALEQAPSSSQQSKKEEEVSAEVEEDQLSQEKAESITSSDVPEVEREGEGESPGSSKTLFMFLIIIPCIYSTCIKFALFFCLVLCCVV